MAKLTGERASDGKYDINVKDKNFRFPSVTTIIGTMKDPELESLKEEIADPEAFKKISMNAANRGTVMHAYLENLCIAIKDGMPRDQALLFTQSKTVNDLSTKYSEEQMAKGLDLFYNIYHSDWMDEMKMPVVMEGLMISFKYKYAGRTDLIFVDKTGKLVMGDFKSSSRIVHPLSTKYVKYKLQLAAYTNAFEEIRKKKIHRGEVIIGHPNGFQKITLSRFEYPIYLDYFLKLRKNFVKAA